MNKNSRRKSLRPSSTECNFETLEPRNLLAADLTNLNFANIGNVGLIYQLSEPVPVDQRLEVLNLHADLSYKESFQLQSVETDSLGFTHFNYQQLAYGIPVEHGVYTVHARSGQIESISGSYIPAHNADATITVRESEALKNALSYAIEEMQELDRYYHGDIHGNASNGPFDAQEDPRFIWEDENGVTDPKLLPSGELLYLQTGETEVTVAWKFDVYAIDPLFKADIYVDANTGEIVKERDGIQAIDIPATGNALYNGPVSITADSFGLDYRLRTNGGTGLPPIQTLDLENGETYSQAVDVISPDTSFDELDHENGVQVHFGGEQAVNYFADTFDRNSYNDFGTTLQSYFSLLEGYNNAFWDGVRLVFGDGDGVNFSPLTSLDVVGHEFTHGVIQSEADLIYFNESGAMNEGFADIFAKSIEYYATGTVDWQIGADFILTGPPIRDLADPDSLGNPDTYLGDDWYSGTDDNGGVHINSTVQSHWFHILADGKIGTNDFGEDYDVTGIGINDAASIAYRSLTTYLTAASEFQDSRVAAIQSAIDLFGAESQQHISTEAAWDAVGVYGFELRFDPQQVRTATGSLIYTDKQPSEIYFPGQVENTSLRVDAGQTISLYANSESVIPTLTVTDPSGNVIGSVTGTSFSTSLHSAPVDVAGEYTISVSSENDTTGTYDVELILNACVEAEEPGGNTNNTMNGAEDLDGTSIALGTSGADRLGITGFLGEGAIIYEFDDFESGTFGPHWTLSSTQPDGLIENWGGPGTVSGTQAMIMHQLPQGPFNLNEAILTTDLTGVTGAELKFWVAEWHEEHHFMPFNSYTGSTDGDGVSISVDGNTWYTMLDQIQTPYGEYDFHEYDLDSFAASKGISLNGPVYFKFQQYDNDSIYSDGAGWDDIQVSVPDLAEDWYSFTLNAGQLASISGSTTTGTTNLMVELYDSAGNLLITGDQYENHSTISQFVNNGASDTFYVRTSGTSLDYSLLVTRDADFDIEPNDQANPQDITNVDGVLGAVFKYRQVSADPDSFDDGDILDSAFADMTLSNDILGGSVWAADTDEIFPAPTGTIVFAPDFGAADGSRETENELRVDFAQLQSKVSIDFGSDDAEDIGWLKAYNSNGTLLQQKQTGGIPFGMSQTLEIDRPQADIAHIVASGFDFHITPLDNLQYTDYVVDDDFYTVTATAGEDLVFHGLLPSDGDFEFDNGLDSPTGSMLGMELFDPAGNLIAADNELISVTAAQAGDFTLRVYAQDGEGEYFIARSLDTTNPIDEPIQSTKFLDGLVAAGTLADTVVSDDVDWQLIPSTTNNPIKQKIDLIVTAETAITNPNSFGFRLEASMTGGPEGEVLQTIQIWNRSSSQWDILDNGIATNNDAVIEVYGSGNLTNYIHPLNGEIIANVVWTSPVFSGSTFNWAIDVDQAGWMIS